MALIQSEQNRDFLVVIPRDFSIAATMATRYITYFGWQSKSNRKPVSQAAVITQAEINVFDQDMDCP